MTDMFRVRTVFGNIAGAPYLSTAYFDSTNPGGVTPQQCVNAVGAFWGAVDNSLALGMTWATEADVAGINLGTGEVDASFGTTPATGTGAGGTGLLPTSVQGVLRWNTGTYIGGRQLRGRWFIPGIATTIQAGNGPTATFQTAVNTAAAALAADAATQFSVWSRTHHSRSTVLSGSLWTTFGVLRSRRT